MKSGDPIPGRAAGSPARDSPFPEAEVDTAPPPAASTLLGIPVSREREWETVERIVGWATRRRRAKVAYANPYVLTLAARDRGFGRLLASFDLVYPDGIGTVWASRILGQAVPERVTASDFHPSLFRRCAEERIGLYLIGGAPGTARTAAEALADRHPALRILGTSHGYLDPAGEARVASDLVRLEPALVLVGMGTPVQERWIERRATALEPAVLWAVGGLFEFVSGRARRAPRWMIATGTEWIFRLARDPGRLARRYTLENARFGAYILRDLALGAAAGGRGHGRGRER